MPLLLSIILFFSIIQYFKIFFSIYAKIEGADKIYACDYSETMVELANRVLSSNHMQQDITLIPKLSNDIIIPEDMPNRWLFLIFSAVV